jgi:hypothetical protein
MIVARERYHGQRYHFIVSLTATARPPDRPHTRPTARMPYRPLYLPTYLPTARTPLPPHHAHPYSQVRVRPDIIFQRRLELSRYGFDPASPPPPQLTLQLARDSFARASRGTPPPVQQRALGQTEALPQQWSTPMLTQPTRFGPEMCMVDASSLGRQRGATPRGGALSRAAVTSASAASRDKSSAGGAFCYQPCDGLPPESLGNVAPRLTQAPHSAAVCCALCSLTALDCVC